MAGSNHLKTYLGANLNRFAEKKVADAIQVQGKALPCRVVAVSGGIATVAFEVTSSFTLPQVSVPVAESIYVRLPVQVGDLGVVRPIDVYLGGVSGQGGGVASLATPANLGALVYEPVASAGWPSVDGSKVIVQGPGGAVVQSIGGGASVTLTTSAITLTAGGHTLVINSSGISLDGKEFAAHVHSGVQTGSGDTGPPV